MIKGVDHVALAVEDLAQATKVCDQLLQQPAGEKEEVDSEGVAVSFYHTAKGKLEIIQGLSAESNVTKYIRKKGNGIHHVAFTVDDIEAEMARVVKQGFSLINETPKKGAGGKLVCFLHPKTTEGILVELCQET